MGAAHNMSRHVLLSLSADPSSGSSIVYPERRVKLTPENAKITIGRASKKTDSGFVAALDNAWFDCAVMSRLHAQISANMDQEKLEIHDVGSLHGTFINGDGPIPPKETRELKDGDTLRFGAPIWRGAEQYVPTTVKVGIRFVNPDASASGKFQVPDSDDESDIDVSTDSDESGKSAEQPSPTTQSTRVNVIDLTGNHGCAGSRQVIDLSSDCGSPISIEDDNEQDTTSHANPGNRNLDGLDVNQASPDGADGLSDLGDVDRDQDTQMHDHAENESEYGENSCGDVTDDINNATDDGLSEEYTSDDDSCDFLDDQSSGSSDDPLNRPDYPPGYTGSVEHPETLALIESLSHPMPQPKTVAPVTIMGLLNRDEPEAPALSSALLLPRMEQSVSDTSLQNSSPSQDLSTGVPCSPTQNISVEYLGAKTGKTDFFIAREQNKLALIAELRTAREEAQDTQRRLASVNPHGWYDIENMLPHHFSPAHRIPCVQALAPLPLPRLADVAEPYTPPTSSGLGLADAYRPLSPPMGLPGAMAGDVDSFSRRTYVGISDIVETHQQSPSNKRKADDISESTREQERWAVETAEASETENTNPTIAASQESSKEEERAPGINNCEDNFPRAMGRFPNQSTIVEEPTTPSFDLSKQGEDNAKSSVMTPSKQGEENTESSVITPPLTPERPAKKRRMMMVAERLGYAALGGVTAGAMIMGTLIYTAPTFG